jgi:acyl-CoA synthetase (AMP-forming)/AMP-acid ligase II
VCEPGQVGEIVHTGSGTMLGYLGGEGDADKLRCLPASLGGGRAVFTGDSGFLDTNDFLHLVGRRDSMIKIAGNRVYPEEATEQLRSIASVRDAEVVVDQHEGAEPRLVAFVVSAGSHPAPPEQIRRLAAERLPSYLVPAEVRVVASLPRLANGKIDRGRLREDVAGDPRS